jgi:hypothetical protein
MNRTYLSFFAFVFGVIGPSVEKFPCERDFPDLLCNPIKLSLLNLNFLLSLCVRLPSALKDRVLSLQPALLFLLQLLDALCHQLLVV